MSDFKQFEASRRKYVKAIGQDRELAALKQKFMERSVALKYSYNFDWLGLPMIQYPQDMAAMQEIIWRVKPDLIIETGIARGGSLIFYASMLELLGKGMVLGVDIDIRAHNRKAIESHRLFKRIKMIEGSSTASDVLKKVTSVAKKHKVILVVLDSNHTYAHVRDELAVYAGFVTRDSYLVAFDTLIKYLPKSLHRDRQWDDKKDNPAQAVAEFLAGNKHFKNDKEIEDKIMLTVAPGGYLKRVK